MPFDDGSFDVVWTDHAQMNIADKHAFYGEIARVLRPCGRLLFHDLFLGDGGPPRYPAFWSEDGSTSFLATPDESRMAMDGAGLAVRGWDDVSRAALDESVAALEAMGPSGPPPLGPHLLTGETGEAKFHNSIRDLREGRIVVIQAVAEKRQRRGLV